MHPLYFQAGTEGVGVRVTDRPALATIPLAAVLRDQLAVDGRRRLAMVASRVRQEGLDLRQLREDRPAELHAAAQKELDKFVKYDVFEETPLSLVPASARLLPPRIVVTSKDAAGTLKYRLTARGDLDTRTDLATRTSNVDWHAVRLALRVGAALHGVDLVIAAADVTAAYLQVPLDSREPVFMRAPPEADCPAGMVWRLRKAVYGLADAGHLFEKRMRDVLLQASFHPSTYLRHTWTRAGTIVLVYVDDVLVLGAADGVEAALRDIAAVLDIERQTGELRYAGVDIDRRADEIVLTQSEYAKEFALDPAVVAIGSGKRYLNPLPWGIELRVVEGGVPLSEARARWFRSRVGQLQFIARETRPDLSFAASFLARASQTPMEHDAHVLARVLSFAASTPEVGVHIALRCGAVCVDAYSDASEGPSGAHHPHGGYVLCADDSALSWASSRLRGAGRGSAVVELIAAADAADAAAATVAAMRELGATVRLVLRTDADDVVAWAHAHGLPKLPERRRLKDLAVVREVMATEGAALLHVAGSRNPADALCRAASLRPLKEKMRSPPQPGRLATPASASEEN